MPRFLRQMLAIGILLFVAIAVHHVYSHLHKTRVRSHASDVLRDLGLALRNYEDTWKRFPPPSMLGHSWRIRVLPYAVSCAHYENYNFSLSWDSSQNMLLDRRLLHDSKWPNEDHIWGMPTEYGAALDFPQQTRFLMIVGDHCVGTNSGGRKASDISDGLSNTIALVETARPDVHWLHPIDLNYGEMSFGLNDGPLSIGAANSESPLVCFCDGEVYRVNRGMTADALNALLTIDGNESIDRETCVTKGWLTHLK